VHALSTPTIPPSGPRLDEGGVPILRPWDWRQIQQRLVDRSLAPDRSRALGKQAATNTRANIRKSPTYHAGDDSGG